MSYLRLDAKTILDATRLHPRVAYQGILADEEARARLVEGLPPLVPFRHDYIGVLALIDWDHRLPSLRVALRIFLYYDPSAFAAGEEAFDDRLEEIGKRDKFPEFDVPDFSDLPADEAYEAEADVDGRVTGCRLTSAWRREIDDRDADSAITLARASNAFAEVSSASTARAAHLGDLEAVSWTPPCESGHARWTLDVWYLLSFDGRLGSGQSMLVDLEDKQVVKSREFNVRTG